MVHWLFRLLVGKTVVFFVIEFVNVCTQCDCCCACCWKIDVVEGT